MVDEPVQFTLRVSIEREGTALYLNYLLECKAGTHFDDIRTVFARELHKLCVELDLKPELAEIKFGPMAEGGETDG